MVRLVCGMWQTWSQAGREEAVSERSESESKSFDSFSSLRWGLAALAVGTAAPFMSHDISGSAGPLAVALVTAAPFHVTWHCLLINRRSTIVKAWYWHALLWVYPPLLLTYPHIFSFTQQNQILLVQIVCKPFFLHRYYKRIDPFSTPQWECLWGWSQSKRCVLNIQIPLFNSVALSFPILVHRSCDLWHTQRWISRWGKGRQHWSAAAHNSLSAPTSKPITTGASRICYIWWHR